MTPRTLDRRVTRARPDHVALFVRDAVLTDTLDRAVERAALAGWKPPPGRLDPPTAKLEHGQRTCLCVLSLHMFEFGKGAGPRQRR